MLKVCPSEISTLLVSSQVPLVLISLVFFASAAAMGWLNQLFPVGALSRAYALPIALIISFASAALLPPGQRSRNFLTAGISLAVLLGTLALSTLYMDFSWDGQAYHQRAVADLLQGTDFLRNDAPTDNRWVNYYTKATWYYAATLVSWFDRSDVGCSYHFVLALAAAAYVYRFCRLAQHGLFLTCILTLIFTLNPVSIAQSYTYYNDAALGSLGTILFIAAIHITRDKTYLDKLIFIISAVVAINVKSSGIIIIGSAFVYMFVYYLANKQLKLAFRENFKIFSIFCLIGIGVLGYSPFIQNITHDRHFFYPLAGKNSVDIITGNAPYGFPEHSRFRNLLVSVFSHSANIAASSHGTEVPVLKIPGEVTNTELGVFIYSDIRIAGFGPLFSLMLITSIFVLAAFRINWFIAGSLYFMVLLAIMVNPHAWWARYAPVMWLLPLIPAFAIIKPRFKMAWLVLLVFLATAMSNIGLVLHKWLGHYPSANAMVKRETKPLQGKLLKVYAGPFFLDLQFKRMGLKYEEVSEEYYKANREKFLPLWSGIEYEKQ